MTNPQDEEGERFRSLQERAAVSIWLLTDDEIEEITNQPEEQEMQEVTAPEVVETLPEVLVRESVTELVLREVESWKGEVLADPSDRKEALRLDSMRKKAKEIRTTAARICKGEREEAIKTQKHWVAIEKQIADRVAPVEAHLEGEFARHEAVIAEAKRQAEIARQAVIQGRIDALTAIGAPVDLAGIQGMSDADWSEYLAKATERRAKVVAAIATANELSDLGDHCEYPEIVDLPVDQVETRLAQARRDHANRVELERIKAEEVEAQRVAEEAAKAAQEAKERKEREEQAAQERIERARLERGALRSRELALLGLLIEVEAAADLGEDAFGDLLEKAIREKRERDAEAQRQREEQAAQRAKLEKLEAEAAAREKADREEAERIENERQAAEARAELERKEQERLARLAKLMPERQKVALWAGDAIAAIPPIPSINDDALLFQVETCAATLRSMLEAVRESAL